MRRDGLVRRPRTLRSATVIQLIGNLSYLASQLVILLALTWITDLRTVGTYALAQAIATPIFAVTEMRLEQVQLTESRYRFSNYIFHRVCAVTVALMALIGVSLAFVDGDAGKTLLVVSVYKATESVLRIFLTEHMRRGESVTVTVVQITRAAATSAAFVIALYLDGLTLAVLAATLAMLAPYVVSSFSLRSAPVTIWVEVRRTDILKRLSVTAFPIGVAYYLGVFTVNLPRYAIEWLHGREALALFSVAAYGVVLFNTVVDTTLQVAMPRLAAHWADREFASYYGLIRKSSIAIAGIGVVGFVGGVAIGDTVLSQFFGHEYAGAYGVLLTLLLAAMVQNQASIMRAALISAHQRRLLVPVSAANLATVLGLAYVAINRFGLSGAGLALLAGQLVAVAAYAAYLTHIKRGANSGPGPLHAPSAGA